MIPVSQRKLDVDKLRQMQDARYETNYALAKSIGVHQTTIKNWKDGKTIPQLEHLGLLAAHFGCTVDELLKEE